MTRKPRGRRAKRVALALMALGLGSLGIVAPASGSSGEGFLCEEAAAHLVDCCPHFDPTALRCDYTWSCDGDGALGPTFTRAESECIERLGCEELQSSGICKDVSKVEGARCF